MNDKREHARDIYNACKTHGEIVDKIREALESRDTIAALRSQLATVTAEREAMREALETLATLGTTISESEYATGYNHAITIIKSRAAAALKGGKG